jgi:hypothetical protein
LAGKTKTALLSGKTAFDRALEMERAGFDFFSYGPALLFLYSGKLLTVALRNHDPTIGTNVHSSSLYDSQ